MDCCSQGQKRPTKRLCLQSLMGQTSRVVSTGAGHYILSLVILMKLNTQYLVKLNESLLTFREGWDWVIGDYSSWEFQLVRILSLPWESNLCGERFPLQYCVIPQEIPTASQHCSLFREICTAAPPKQSKVLRSLSPWKIYTREGKRGSGILGRTSYHIN